MTEAAAATSNAGTSNVGGSQTSSSEHVDFAKMPASEAAAKKAEIINKMKQMHPTNANSEAKATETAPNMFDKVAEKKEVSQPNEGDEDLFSAFEKMQNEGDEWFLDGKTKGEGSRPDWLTPEHKSVEAQAKSYKELLKKFGDFRGAPEAYDYTGVENDKFNIKPGAKNALGFEKIAREMGMSQAGFKKCLEYFSGVVAPTFSPSGETPVDSRAEIAKLGSDGAEKFQVLTTWLKNQHPEEYGVFRKMIRTADDIKAFLRLRSKMVSSDEPVIHDSGVMPSRSNADIRNSLFSELAEAKKSGDSYKVAQVAEKYKRVYGGR